MTQKYTTVKINEDLLEEIRTVGKAEFIKHNPHRQHCFISMTELLTAYHNFYVNTQIGIRVGGTKK